YYPGDMTVVVRTAMPPNELLAAARRIVHDLEARLPIARERTLEQVVAAATARARLTALLLLVAASAALVLGAVGLYAFISYTVTQRSAEFGIRLALGASPVDLRAMVVRQGAILAGIGLVAGLIGALAFMRLLRAILYQVGAMDPIRYGVTMLVLLLVCVAASYIPARRASQTDPTIALRVGW